MANLEILDLLAVLEVQEVLVQLVHQVSLVFLEEDMMVTLGLMVHLDRQDRQGPLAMAQSLSFALVCVIIGACPQSLRATTVFVEKVIELGMSQYNVHAVTCSVEILAVMVTNVGVHLKTTNQ